MSTSLNRESLRLKIRSWSDVMRLIALERAVEQLPDAVLEKLLDGLVHWDEHRIERSSAAESLCDRVEAHAAATRQGKFRAELEMGHRWGEREPWQTAAWLAATWHLLDLVRERVNRNATDDDLPASLRTLTDLIEGVDARPEELVVFEDDDCADLHFGNDLKQVAQIIAGARSATQAER